MMNLPLLSVKIHFIINFQGYSTHSECNVIGLGSTAIESVDDSYSQNKKTLDQYGHDLENDILPIFRGITLNKNDKIRRMVITQLICHFSLDINKINKKMNIHVTNYFSDELIT